MLKSSFRVGEASGGLGEEQKYTVLDNGAEQCSAQHDLFREFAGVAELISDPHSVENYSSTFLMQSFSSFKDISSPKHC